MREWPFSHVQRCERPPVVTWSECCFPGNMTTYRIVAVVALLGCEDCPDRTLGIETSPDEIARGVQTAMTVSFPEDVFLEPSPERERDLRIELHRSVDDVLVAEWDGSHPPVVPDSIDGIATPDARTLAFSLRIAPGEPAGSYGLDVTADSAGACEGPNGRVVLNVR